MVEADAVPFIADQGCHTMIGRILAVDPGDKRIGIAVSDPMGVIANPVTILIHVSRRKDAEHIVKLVEEYQAVKIIIGCPYDQNGEIGPKGRKSVRLAEVIRELAQVPVELFDETGTSIKAQQAVDLFGKSRKRRSVPIDDLAATVLLQDYLDSMNGQVGI